MKTKRLFTKYNVLTKIVVFPYLCIYKIVILHIFFNVGYNINDELRFITGLKVYSYKKLSYNL